MLRHLFRPAIPSGVCFWCVVCGDFLGCLVDMVCLCHRDGSFDEFDFDDVITFWFLVQSLGF